MTAQGDVVLQLVQVTKKYRNSVAVDDISIDVRRGEILTLLGPSGCGKTTTLRLSVGLERCTLGTVTYRGRIVDSPAQRIYEPPNRRDMGMVFQSYAIWPHMTVAENVAYPLKVRRIARAEIAAEVNRVLALVGLDGFADRPATQLSGGQQQRVALARALVSKPDILLLDEPFSNLDAKLREQMRTEVKILQRRLGITVLFVTHDQTEALSLSDRIAVMQNGKVEQLGPPQELYANPRTPAVRDFLGRTLSFTGKLVEQAGGEQRVALSSGLQLTVRGCSRGVKLSVGDACLVTVRPEFVVAQPAEGSGPIGENTITARLFALLFMGNHYEASLETPNGENILVTLPASGSWQERQALVLFLPADRLQLWPARSS